MSYSPPVIEADMSNYYRLLREKTRRDKLVGAFPDYRDKLNDIYQNNPAVASFLQAIPTADLGPEYDPQSVQPGVITRDINLSNSIIERKIFLKRIFEAVATGTQAQSDKELAIQQLSAYCAELGLDQKIADQAVHEITHAAENMVRTKAFKVVPGGLKP